MPDGVFVAASACDLAFQLHQAKKQREPRQNVGMSGSPSTPINAPSDERARLIATADMLLGSLKDLRARQSAADDVEIVERWIFRVAGLRATLDSITEWTSAEAYSVNAFHPGEALRRLFPAGLDDSDFDHEVERLEREIARDWQERPPASPSSPMTHDEQLVDLLTGHASARFRYLDVRNAEAWRSERLEAATNIPLDRVTAEAAKTFSKDVELVVFGDDDRSTEEGARRLKSVGFHHVLMIPGGFRWFGAHGFPTDRGPTP